MKRYLMAMFALTLFPRLLAAQEPTVDDLVGTEWYGLYLNGTKSGWAMIDVTKNEADEVIVTEDAHIKVTMGAIRQDLQIFSERVYAPDGNLDRIDSVVNDPSGETKFSCVVEGDVMHFEKTVGGQRVEKELPKPDDSLKDILKQRRLVGPGAEIGDELSFSFFEPMYMKEFNGLSRIVGVEERLLEGAHTTVFTINTKIDLMGIETTSYVTEGGTMLEDQTAGFMVMRLEPEAIAKDVSYSNDVVVSNAALLDESIPNARERDTLTLSLDGPLTDVHLFNDERQYLAATDNGDFLFKATAVDLDGFEPVNLPVENPEVTEWLEPTTFVQSDDERLAAKAKEVIGDEKNTVKAAEKLCHWVYDNVNKSFSARLTNALEVLKNREGDCTEHSILFIGLCRAAGIPAREVAGLVYVADPDPGFYFHQWAKVWVGKWVDVDPTFNQPIADVTHIKLAEGDLLAQAKIIPIIGRIDIEVVEDQPVVTGD